MKTAFNLLTPLFLGAALIASGCAKKRFSSWESFKNPEVVSQLKSFVAEKEAQANAADKASGQSMPPELDHLFRDAAKGDWLEVNTEFKDLRNHAPQYAHSGTTDTRLRGIAWQSAIEVWGAFDGMAEGDEKYSTLYAEEIVNSIPPGSIYFGGTDPGRFLITGMEKSQVNGNPFFLITQNALVDSSYLDYVRSMYGNQLYIPTAEDSEKCFRDYTAEAEKRLQNHQLRPGEDVQVNPQSGRVQISGQVPVMTINGLLVKIIFDQNSNQEFYIEQSYPLDWMYPYLEPHGLILRLNRRPLPELSDADLKQDHDYWTKLIQPMIGDWLNDDTPVQDVADFAKKVFSQHDFTGFTGDPQFVQNNYSSTMFSKERANIADLYLWRAKHATNATEEQRMNLAAGYACRQAWALCPYSPEAAFRYVNLLISKKRMADALLVAETTADFRSSAGIPKSQFTQVDDLVANLKKFQQK